MPENRIISPDEAIAALLSAQESDGLSAEHIAQLSDLVSQARGSTENTLRVVESPLPSLEVISRLNIDKQYEGFVDTLKYFGFINPDGNPKVGDVQMPALDRIKRAFYHKKLELAQSYEEPRLVIYPDMPFQEQIKILQDREFGFKSVYADSKANDKAQSNVGRRITKWGASIINATPISDDADRVPLRKRLDTRKAQSVSHESKMTKEKALMFMLDAVRNRKGVQTFTMLLDGEKSPVNSTFDGRSITGDEILFGLCDAKKMQICFNAYQLGGCISSASLYSSVDADL